jgi:hypothetical protein
MLLFIVEQLITLKCPERFFIALSFSPKLERQVVEDLMKKQFKGLDNLAETVVYTGGAFRKYSL